MLYKISSAVVTVVLVALSMLSGDTPTAEATHGPLPCYQCDTYPTPYNRAVSLQDMGYLLEDVGPPPDNSQCARCDLNKDGFTSLADGGILLTHVGENHTARVYRVILNQILNQSNQPVIWDGTPSAPGQVVKDAMQ